MFFRSPYPLSSDPIPFLRLQGKADELFNKLLENEVSVHCVDNSIHYLYLQSLVWQHVQAKVEGRPFEVKKMKKLQKLRNELRIANANYQVVDFKAMERHISSKGNPRLVIDAQHFGNHARFANDFRGTGKTRANAAFTAHEEDTGDSKLWVTAMFDITAGQEILVNYGADK